MGAEILVLPLDDNYHGDFKNICFRFFNGGF